MKKFITLVLITCFIFTIVIPVFAEDGDVTATAIENGITMNTGTDAAVNAAEVKDDIIFKSDVKSFRGKFTKLLANLNTLRIACKSNWEAIKKTQIIAEQKKLIEFKQDIEKILMEVTAA